MPSIQSTHSSSSQLFVDPKSRDKDSSAPFQPKILKTRVMIPVVWMICELIMLFPWLASLAGAQEVRRVHRHVPAAVAESRVLGEVAGTAPMRLAIGLPLRNTEELDGLLAGIADPTSPNYKHYLTPEQFAARFSPSETDYQAVAEYARAHGLRVTGTHANRMVLDVSGAAADVADAMHVKMMHYRHPQRGDFFAPDREPTVDASVKVLDVSGLDNYVVPQPMSLTKAPVALTGAGPTALVTGSGPGGYFIGKDFRAAYAPGVTLTGAGQVVGLLEFDGFFAGDVTKNFAAAGLPAVATQTVLVDGVSGAAGSNNTEVILDIMMAAYMAPGLSKVIVYEGAYPNDVLNKMATDNAASQLSSSWTFGGINATTEQIFKQYIAQGQTLLQASGDSGAYTSGVAPPADDPNLTVVGGTSLTTSGSGGPWGSEKAWSGSGGGRSTSYAIPSYQQGINFAASGGSTTMRNIPDVALTADVQMYLVQNNGQAIVVGGTSAAAPLWAGFMALANQQSGTKGRIGFLNPLIYAIGNSGNYGQDFNDVKTGSNGYAAVSGYDLATGWGSPAGQHLINDLTGTTTAASFTLTSSVAALTVRQGAAGTSALTVVGKNSFAGTVGLTVAGLPSGVTASFSPATTTGTSVVTFAVGNAVATGTYALTVTGTSGSLTGTAPIALTVVAPSFGLAASAAAVTVVQGATATDAIAVAGLNGFTSSVALSVSGLPTGVTYALSAANTTSGSTLTFTASSMAVTGNYPVTVNGVSGTLKGAATITLTVAPAPSFTLTSSVASLSIAQGKSGTGGIGVVGKNGFSGAVALSIAGLPTGVTATFSPASTTATSTLTLNVGAAVAGGTYLLTVTGTSGVLKQTATISLVVLPQSFTLGSSVSSLTVPQGKSGISTISVVGANGFSGSVALTATGLPVGVTAAFSAASATTTSVVTFTAATTATVGTYMVTVSGVSGTLKASTTVAITVVAPTFSLTALSAGMTVAQGASGIDSINVVTANGFSGVVAFTATGLPAGVTATIAASTSPTTYSISLIVSGTAAAGVYPVTVVGTSGSLRATTVISLTVTSPGFSFSLSAPSLQIPRGTSSSAVVTIVRTGGFQGTVSMTATGLPSGVTFTFGAISASGAIPVTFSASSAAAVGSVSYTLTAVSGSISRSAVFVVNVIAPTAGTSLVNLSPGYNVNALSTDGTAYGGVGLDGALNGSATTYSANLIGSQQTIGGTLFYFGAANALDAVSSTTIALPLVTSTSLKLLATALNGAQMQQVFKVTYTDGTSTSFVQSMSDWFVPQGFAGEAVVMKMGYRNNNLGQRDNRTFCLSEYVLSLNSAKTVASVTLPNNRNVVVLAASLTGVTAAVR